ncbi:MAG: hypothetical protein ACYCS8_02045 [Acidithiobacillus sp.]|jgi:hypothetical protein
MQLDQQDHQIIEDIIQRRAGIASMQEQIKEDIKAIAARAGVKAAKINKVIVLVEKERAKGDVLEGERGIIDAAETIAGCGE